MNNIIMGWIIIASFGGLAIVAGVLFYWAVERGAKHRERIKNLSMKFSTIIFNGTQFIEFDSTGHAIHPRGCHCWLVGETIISSNCPKHGD